jgi:DNA-binding SARP family transcriptional activator/tetratricopeptide (TPR) repeat protein
MRWKLAAGGDRGLMVDSGRDPAGGELWVAVLGPLEITVSGQPVAVTAPRLRTLLAVLAMSAGRAVAVDRLATAAWGEELPRDTRATVQTYITRLRGVLGEQLIGTGQDGYLLRAEPDQVDALRFVRLLDAAAAAPEPAAERALLAQALALWRGEPFEDVRTAWLADVEARRLVERYLAAVERRIDLDLADGRANELVAELSELTARHSLRESLWLRLLVVLDRCGRQAEALERYEAARVRLAEELGADPGPELQQMHADLLAGRPLWPARDAARAAAQQVVPRQLPADVDVFTGRQAALAGMEKLLGSGDDDGALPPVVVSALTGTAGIGKSALAIHAAHRVAGRFPDGQLYVNLHGATAGLRPLQPLEVLGRFLRALGVDSGAIPGEVEEAAALFRSRVAGRRLLVVLDDAADSAQVRPLLPASPGCGVVVTSRRLLASLEGAHHLHLDVLAPDEATELLGRLAGEQRVAAEPEAAAEVARLCGWLPLALRIAGARLAVRPAWPVAELAGRLADAQRRLDELELADVGVRTSFTVSYQQLRTNDDPADRAAAAAFGLLGLSDGPELGVPVAARLLDVGEQAAERVLERLADAHLLQTPQPGRYRMHDLLRLYARELAQQHPHDERAAAMGRALGFYAATAWHTLELLRPGDPRLGHVDDRWSKGGLEFADDQAALTWLDTERANLLAAVEQVATCPGAPAELATQLAQALQGFFWIRNYLQDWEQVNHTALEVARRTGDRAAEAQILHNLGTFHWRQGNYAQTLAYNQESLAIFRDLGDPRGQGMSQNNLGIAHERLGRYQEALACYQESLDISRELADRRGQSISQNNLGMLHERLGRYQEALACHQESLDISRERGDRHGQAISLSNLGTVYERLDQDDLAMAHQYESLAIYQELGDRRGQAYCLNRLGSVLARQGRREEALAGQQKALALYEELGDSYGRAESLRELGLTLLGLGRPQEARAHWQQALAIFEQLQTADVEQVRALLAEEPAAHLPEEAPSPGAGRRL